MNLLIPFVANTSESIFFCDADAVGNARSLAFDARIFHLCNSPQKTFIFNCKNKKSKKLKKKKKTLQR